jgi:hypothetical protein
MPKNDPREFDVRVVKYHLRHRNITEADHAAHHAALPDEADECVKTETRFSNSFERRHFSDDEAQG